MSFSPYAFIPLGVLLAAALAVAAIALWPGARRRDRLMISKKPAHSAEILQFPRPLKRAQRAAHVLRHEQDGAGNDYGCTVEQLEQYAFRSNRRFDVNA